jgi:hypothetical protein
VPRFAVEIDRVKAALSQAATDREQRLLAWYLREISRE